MTKLQAKSVRPLRSIASFVPNQVRGYQERHKPEGELARWDRERHPMPVLTQGERLLLNFITDHADLIDLPKERGAYGRHYRDLAHQWLLIPAPQWVIDQLSLVEADLSDVEDDGTEEPGADYEEESAGEWKPRNVVRIRKGKRA